jgi:tRNA modification GTPase
VFSPEDTIVAIATPPGRGGIGVVRLSGPAAHAIARQLITDDRPLAPRHARLTLVRPSTRGVSETTALPGGDAIDEAVVVYFPAPASYTAEDVVEVSVHGSPCVLQAILEASISAGARLAEPGEFTLRAYLNGRMDLMQAEAVADLIDAVTPLQARTAFDQLQGTLTREIGELDGALFELIARLEASVDFPEEGYHFVDPGALARAIDSIADRMSKLLAQARRGRLVREGLQIAIVGEPNVGKSSLFNALVGVDRAIVTDVPGTTRDLVSERVDLEGLSVTLVDTAGLRETDDIVESEGVARSVRAAGVSDLTLVVADGSRSDGASHLDVPIQITVNKRLIVINKCDIGQAWSRSDAVSVSARTGAGLDQLRRRIAVALGGEPVVDRPEITNIRHIELVRRAHGALIRARDALYAAGGSLSEEFVLADLQEARGALEEVTGKRASDEVLAHIFERFCIGK